jgi:hypothetical protein
LGHFGCDAACPGVAEPLAREFDAVFIGMPRIEEGVTFWFEDHRRKVPWGGERAGVAGSAAGTAGGLMRAPLVCEVPGVH